MILKGLYDSTPGIPTSTRFRSLSSALISGEVLLFRSPDVPITDQGPLPLPYLSQIGVGFSEAYPRPSQIGVHLRYSASIGVELRAFSLCSFVPFVVEGCFNEGPFVFLLSFQRACFRTALAADATQTQLAHCARFEFIIAPPRRQFTREVVHQRRSCLLRPSACHGSMSTWPSEHASGSCHAAR